MSVDATRSNRRHTPRTVNAVVVYLTQNTPRRRFYLQSSIYFLFRSFNWKYRYPIKIFHEGDFSPEDCKAVREGVPDDLGNLIEFVQLAPEDFTPPTSLETDVVLENRLIVPEPRSLKYRLMCRWWTLHLSKYLVGYEYYMRLDDDSQIEQTLHFDPFAVCQQQDIDYASNLIHIEHPLNALGLQKASRSILGNCSRVDALFVRSRITSVIEPSRLSRFRSRLPQRLRGYVSEAELSCPVMYYNNFHVAKVQVWANSVIRQFFYQIDQLGGVFYFRWGDAVLHTLALAAVDELHVRRFGFRYSKRHEREHGPYTNTEHFVAQQFFGAGRIAGLPSGSMTDFPKFNSYLAKRRVDDIFSVIEV